MHFDIQDPYAKVCGCLPTGDIKADLWCIVMPRSTTKPVRIAITSHFAYYYFETRPLLSFVIMSNNSIDLQKWVRKAASLIISAPVLMVPQAMRAANFTDAQSRDPTLQQRVRRMVASVKKRALDAGVPQRECTTVDIDPNPSPVSAMSSNNTESTTSMDPQPTLLQLEPVRLTVGGSIKSINNAKKVEAVKLRRLLTSDTLIWAHALDPSLDMLMNTNLSEYRRSSVDLQETSHELHLSLFVSQSRATFPLIR